jgi:O-methyltransferase domain/Dimerisation domain
MPAKPLEYIYPGILAAQAIHTAVRFRIPDLLASGPKTVAELALACDAHEPTLERLLRALTTIEMFVRTPEGRYRNSPLTEVLRSDHPLSLRSEGMLLPAPFMWLPLGELGESVRSGKPAFERLFGQSFFEYLAEHPDDAANFNRVMTQEIMWTTPALLRAYDFSRFKQLVDVGGGQGLFLSNVLAATPKLKGVLFDQPKVVDEAKGLLKGEIAARTEIVGGSFFESVPEGGDAYLLRKVIHDWEDEDAVRILRNVRLAMCVDGTLILVEGLVDSAQSPAGLMDLMMLVFFRGRERTEADFRSLLQSAGFSLTRVIPAGDYCLIEGRPA